MQSFIVPLQGFLNAIVYGWTREDFAQLLAIGKSHLDGWDLEGSEENSGPGLEESEYHQPAQSNLILRSSHEVEENSVVPDESDDSS